MYVRSFELLHYHWLALYRHVMATGGCSINLLVGNGRYQCYLVPTNSEPLRDSNYQPLSRVVIRYEYPLQVRNLIFAERPRVSRDPWGRDDQTPRSSGTGKRRELTGFRNGGSNSLRGGAGTSASNEAKESSKVAFRKSLAILHDLKEQLKSLGRSIRGVRFKSEAGHELDARRLLSSSRSRAERSSRAATSSTATPLPSLTSKVTTHSGSQKLPQSQHGEGSNIAHPGHRIATPPLPRTSIGWNETRTTLSSLSSGDVSGRESSDRTPRKRTKPGIEGTYFRVISPSPLRLSRRPTLSPLPLSRRPSAPRTPLTPAEEREELELAHSLWETTGDPVKTGGAENKTSEDSVLPSPSSSTLRHERFLAVQRFGISKVAPWESAPTTPGGGTSGTPEKGALASSSGGSARTPEKSALRSSSGGTARTREKRKVAFSNGDTASDGKSRPGQRPSREFELEHKVSETESGLSKEETSTVKKS
jgi:hypothetical protein